MHTIWLELLQRLAFHPHIRILKDAEFDFSHVISHIVFQKDLANFHPLWNLTSLLAHTEYILNATEGDARRIFEHMGKERKSGGMKVHHLNPRLFVLIKIKFYALPA